MKKKQFVFCGIAGIFLGFLLYGVLIEPNLLKIRHVCVDNLGSGQVLRGKIAVHISDLHVSQIGKIEKKILKIIREIGPGFIFLTGDYVKWNGNYEVALEFLSRLEAKVGIWAVMGDYDYSCSRKSCLFCHEPGTGLLRQRHSVRFLRNSLERVKTREGYLWIGAIDAETDRPFRSEMNLSPWGGKEPAIILAHNPLIFDSFDDDQAVLMLAGDTHGGQIALPSWLWKILGYDKCAKYNQGLFEKGRKKMFVSRGVGTSHLPIRILRRPEVVVLHF